MRLEVAGRDKIELEIQNRNASVKLQTLIRMIFEEEKHMIGTRFYSGNTGYETELAKMTKKLVRDANPKTLKESSALFQRYITENLMLPIDTHLTMIPMKVKITVQKKQAFKVLKWDAQTQEVKPDMVLPGSTFYANHLLRRTMGDADPIRILSWFIGQWCHLAYMSVLEEFKPTQDVFDTTSNVALLRNVELGVRSLKNTILTGEIAKVGFDPTKLEELLPIFDKFLNTFIYPIMNRRYLNLSFLTDRCKIKFWDDADEIEAVARRELKTMLPLKEWMQFYNLESATSKSQNVEVDDFSEACCSGGDVDFTLYPGVEEVQAGDHWKTEFFPGAIALVGPTSQAPISYAKYDSFYVGKPDAIANVGRNGAYTASAQPVEDPKQATAIEIKKRAKYNLIGTDDRYEPKFNLHILPAYIPNGSAILHLISASKNTNVPILLEFPAGDEGLSYKCLMLPDTGFLATVMPIVNRIDIMEANNDFSIHGMGEEYIRDLLTEAYPSGFKVKKTVGVGPQEKALAKILGI